MGEHRIVKPRLAHKAFRDEAIDLMKKHGGDLPAPDMLAIASHLVGQILAYQDQRTMTKARANSIILRNIEIGNAEAIAQLNDTKGSA